MEDLWHELLGLEADSHSITAGQMCARAVVVFLVALALLRLSGKRTFASSSAFNMVLKIILGAVLSRAIVAASPFGATLLASAVLVLLHRLLAWAAFRSKFIGRLIKGAPVQLVKDGRYCEDNMRRASISHNDLLEGLRHGGHRASLEGIDQVYLERNGHISVVKKKPKPGPAKQGAEATLNTNRPQ
ncbi:DUF421 domain-containing protein [Hymenobacter chitinivorans]|uniref:Uncharacterized protein DUF421 n=1 Tax=Hymenobacter chitinivorans DSM 11115 TaxID=1121954 RepID=A0A2M9B9H1_9BACT|nr:YetF domain-containing protein [Hymenobacter chitinivorans]PJJ54593.1 uncharacterized protein DUF421 [Hymenobacter chitinivorans DSM 11115]